MTIHTTGLMHQSEQDMQHAQYPNLALHPVPTKHTATAAGMQWTHLLIWHYSTTAGLMHQSKQDMPLVYSGTATLSQQDTKLPQQTSDRLTWLRCSGDTAAGNSACIHESLRGLQPIWPGSTYTMPHLLTVAGDATTRSCTSKIMFCCTHTEADGQFVR